MSSRHLTDIQWVVVDAKVYDLSKFANMHPGGAAVLFAEGIGAFLYPPCYTPQYLTYTYV
jgi:hypothetical protein